MEKHLAVFVTDGTELIGIEKDTKGFCWQEFCWFHDHFFMTVINQLLELQSPAKIVFGTKQIPRKWMGARHFVLSFERFMLITEKILNASPPMEDFDDEFKMFYTHSLQYSFERLRELRDDVKGLYKVLPDDLFVLFMIYPVPPFHTSIEYLYEQWDKKMLKVDEIFAQLKEITKE